MGLDKVNADCVFNVNRCVSSEVDCDFRDQFTWLYRSGGMVRLQKATSGGRVSQMAKKKQTVETNATRDLLSVLKSG